MLERIGRAEFFAILPPGFYVLLAAVVGLGPMDPRFARAGIWLRLEPSAVRVGHEAALAFLVLFGSYLAGILLRTIPLKTVERCIPPFRVQFPHSEELRRFLSQLRRNPKETCADLTHLPLLEQPLTMAVFNHWKNGLCIRSPEGYRSYQSFESRSRMFAGMFWSGFLGIVGSLMVVLRSDGGVPRYAWEMLGISVLVVALFGAQFRRVRAQEAIVLLSLFGWSGAERRSAG